MSMDPDLLALLTDRVKWLNATGHDAYGKPKFADPVTLAALVEEKRRFTRNAQGDIVQVTRTVYIAGEIDITPSDRLELPDGSTPAIVGVFHARDFGDDERPFVHHTEVTLS